jgi:hypothetical protein
MLQEAKITELEHAQRVQVSLERTSAGKRVKIEVESHDNGLGWYTSGTLALPLHELPLLEQALEAMRRGPADNDEEYGKIIPFPANDLDLSA